MDEKRVKDARFIQEAVDAFRECSRFPSLSSARIGSLDKIQESTARRNFKITSNWSQRDIEQAKNKKFLRTHFISSDKVSGSVEDVKCSMFPVETQNMQLYAVSPSEQLQAVVRKTPGLKNEEENQFIEIWSSDNLVKSVDLKSLDKHGKIYDDSQFGCLEWSPSEKFLLYVAEKKLPKTCSYFERPPAEETPASKPAPQKGGQYDFVEDWGEQLVSKHLPVLVVLNITTEELNVLDEIPGHISPGQASWSAGDEGVVFVGWEHEPYRLGLIYCTQRRSAVYHWSLADKVLEKISAEEYAVHSPRFDPTKEKLIYFAVDAGGPHQACARLILYQLKTKSTSVLVDVVQAPDHSGFPGIYIPSLQGRCWSSDGTKVIMSTAWRSSKHIILVDTSTKSVRQLTKAVGCWSVLDAHGDFILASHSSPDSPPKLMLATLPEGASESPVSWTVIADPAQQETSKNSISWQVLTLSPEDGGQNFEAILLEPIRAASEGKPALVVYPHGGPHSLFLADFMLYPVALCKLGYAVLLVNYRGSIGFGQASLMSLPGNIGTQDVADVQLAARTILEQGRVNVNNVFVIGGSHGGFLASHVIGQYPDFYRACVIRNPVVNIVTMVGSTDIPDWTYFESGSDFTYDSKLSAEKCTEMLHKSPISHVSKVKAPTLIMLGEDDRRVPPAQGKEFYKALKARGVKVRMLVYPKNAHPINTVEAESDAFVNIACWFRDHRADS